jgi:hypothetical protein
MPRSAVLIMANTEIERLAERRANLLLATIFEAPPVELEAHRALVAESEALVALENDVDNSPRGE